MARKRQQLSSRSVKYNKSVPAASYVTKQVRITCGGADFEATEVQYNVSIRTQFCIYDFKTPNNPFRSLVFQFLARSYNWIVLRAVQVTILATARFQINIRVLDLAPNHLIIPIMAHNRSANMYCTVQFLKKNFEPPVTRDIDAPE